MTTSAVQCPSCQAVVAATGRFCSMCGQALSSPSQAATAPAQNLPAFGGRVGRLASADGMSGGFTPGLVVADRYRIIGLLGRGGMGEVYRADDLKLGQPVALKFLPRELADDADRRARFFAEVRITRQLSHPNICRVYDISDVDGWNFLSMEFIDGEDLASLITRIGYLSNEKALEIARQIAAGLAAAHSRGVLHRDLKPANIMLDGHGRVRITDFGLAIAADAAAQAQEVDLSGTPAYMAPEQLAGKAASVRSDIYALGLVLYEIVCGRKAFTAASLGQLREQKEGRLPQRPSEIRAGLDPGFERVIMRCLERDPAARYASVAQVAALLPGGDPLAAAIAAGETPSPEMLIASGSTQGLRPVLAIALLAAVVVGALAAAAINDRVGLPQRVKLRKSPEALAERAREFLEKSGYSTAARDTAFGLYHDPDALRYLARRSADSRSDTDPAPALGFFYRQSPEPLVSLSMLSGVDPGDPPLRADGDIEVRLDGEGRLRALDVVPPRVQDDLSTPPPTDWSVLFTEANLDLRLWSPVVPRLNPPFFVDARAAWQGSLPGAPNETVRVEAASYRGRPVSFRIVAPWTPESPTGAFRSGSPMGVFETVPVIFVVVTTVLAGAGLFFARRNLRLGRSDRRGATRLMLLVLTVSTVAWMLIEHHVAGAGEGLLFTVVAGFLLPFSGVLWMYYVAVEPFVRRQWPQILVAWTRVLSGHGRDPLVGREALIGCAAGVATWALIMAFYAVELWRTRAPLGLLTPDWNMLNGVSSYVGAVFMHIGNGVFGGLASLLVLFLLRVALRKDWPAAVVYAAVRGLPFSVLVLGLSSWLVAPLGLLTGLLSYLVVMRAGLVAAMVSSFVVYLLLLTPTTLSSSSWWVGISSMSLIIVFGLASYGFRTSLGGRRIHARTRLDD